MAAGPAPLPDALRRHEAVDLAPPSDPDRHGLGAALARLLRSPPAAAGLGSAASPDGEEVAAWATPEAELRAFRPSKAPKLFLSFRAQLALKELVISDVALLAAYERLIEAIIAPYLLQRLNREPGCEALVAGAALRLWYQYPPTVRVQRGGDAAFRRAHSDDEYGHQDGELNFWLPLTDPEATGTTLWLESRPGAGDFAPVALALGQAVCFHGTSCRHHVPANASESTRVSMDFRVGLGPCFDANFRKPGVKYVHPRRWLDLALPPR